MTPSRRAFLAAAGFGSALLAGCSQFTSDDSGDLPEPDEPPEAGIDELPDSSRHIHGADGTWSSFGCNAANTRAVADGAAPVDGVSERWRVELPEIVRREPVVADGRTYVVDVEELRAFDAADGSDLWSFEGAMRTPLVREDTVYVSTHEGIHALEADSGDKIWSRELDAPGSVTAPATIADRQLLCGIGERVLALDLEDGSERWHQDVFGQVLAHPAYVGVRGIAVVTDAGMAYVLRDDGVADARWELPARPTGSPTGNEGVVYVPCGDGNTYALTIDDSGGSVAETAWTAETGSVPSGLAVSDGLVLGVSGGTLRAIDADTGRRRWEFGIGDRNHNMAPVVGRETVFVGGDSLWALDPAPGGDPDDGPAIRFEWEFDGRLGPGPVLDDGILYVFAEVDGEFALLALENDDA